MEYNPFLIPNEKIPSNIIIVFKIKFVIAILILKYFFKTKAIILIPPDENPSL